MNFGDKLIELRKKAGLSQEELGEKLNVTRQTISKWELNQTIPDMNKLKEISDFFDVSVDSLTHSSDNATKKAKSNNINDMHPRKWLLVVLIIIGLVIVVVLLDKVVRDYKTKKGEVGGIFDTIYTQITDETDIFDDFDTKTFNSSYEMYMGTEYGSSTGYLLDKVITNNKKNKDKLITVVWGDVSTTDPNEIKELKKKLETFDKYENSIDYNDEGLVNKVTIEPLNDDTNTDVDSENNSTSSNSQSGNRNSSSGNNIQSNDDWFEKNTFNSSFTVYTHSSTWGTGINMLLDTIIGSNQNSGHIISVSYNGIVSSDAGTIKGFKNSIDSWSSYSVGVDYDANGYVNLVKISEV